MTLQVHNPNDSQDAIPAHCLEPGRIPALALLSVSDTSGTRIRYFTGPDDLIDAANRRRNQLIAHEPAGFKPPGRPRTVPAAAAILATPCTAFYLIDSADTLMDLACQFHAAFESIDRALNDLFRDFQVDVFPAA